MSDRELSMSMSYILRHGARKERVKMDDDGFVREDDLLKWLNKSLKGNYTSDDLQKAVRLCPKQRFYCEMYQSAHDVSPMMYYRANQGHTISDVKIEMELVSDPNEIPVAVHGTYRKAFRIIKEKGLSRMKRQHIHLATGLPEHTGNGSSTPKSGMRSNVEVLIYIDIAQAMSDGIKFYRSANDVILTEGIDGILDPKYFSKVEFRN